MIRVCDLSKRFEAVTALDGVSFEVNAGECFALLGPNGSGKTTLLKCLAGLVIPSSGWIQLNGLDLQQAREQISYLPQKAAFPEHLTVREVLEFHRRLRGLPSRRVETVMRMFECAPYARRIVTGLSGGMQQRVAIAVACLPDAPVLVLDEPTASLDPRGAIDFRRLLAEMKRAGKTVLFATHVLADVEKLADRVAILLDGRLLAVEPVSALKASLNAHEQSLEEIYLRYVHADHPDRSGSGAVGSRRLSAPLAAARGD